jgi:hypothetical protein
MIPALVLLAALALPLADDPALARPASAPLPAALHLSSFGSMRAARVGADGRVDSGAGVLQLLDGATGAPLPTADLHCGNRPDLWAEFTAPLGGSSIEVKLLAVPVDRGGDSRVRAVLRIAAFDRGTEPVSIHLAASLTAGGGDPAARPFPSLPFEAGAVWAREGDYITRDGRVVLGWTGLPPVVTLREGVAGAGDEVARLDWQIDLLPDSARLIELGLAGPPATAVVDEPAFREGFQRWNYLLSEEQLGWQSRYRGLFADIELYDKRLWYALVGALHQLRVLGDADQEARAFSDRPFGHPASDGAFDAEAIGVFAEWGFGDWAVKFHKQLLAELMARGEPLPPARRVALVHGLARSVRLGVDAMDTQALATAIRALVGKDAEGVEVRPWLDPELVRADLQAVLDESTPMEGYELPHFAWAQAPAGSVAAQFTALRRSVSAHDGVAALAQLGPLVASTSIEGFGSMSRDGTPDGEWPLAFATVFRDLFFDDHGEDLHLFPAIGHAMVPERGALALPQLPTRYGVVEAEVHIQAKTMLATLIKRMGAREPRSILWHVPPGFAAGSLSKGIGGEATLRPDGLVECVLGPDVTRGLSFAVKPTPAR